MTTDETRIAVVGGGIGGLTAAAALLRSGLDCRVFEQAPELAEVGAGIQIAPNASRLLHRLGLADYLKRVAVRPHAIEMRRWDDDTVLRRTPLGQECEDTFGAPYYAVHRADLHAGLVELLPDGVLEIGRQCVGIEERPDGVELRFADGSVETADVVLGADGIHSRVRELLASDEPRFSGQSVYRALVPATQVPAHEEGPKVVLWLGPGQHCVSYPVSAGDFVNLVATTPAEDWRTESWGAEGRTQDLVAAYDDWSHTVRRLVAAPSTVSRWALHDRDPLDRWSTERVTLLGDAAHPMLPFMAQGANQAVEDGAALAVCLRDALRSGGGDRAAIASALRRYEQLRIQRTADVLNMSRGNTTALHLPDGEEQQRRDTALAAGASLESQAWLYGYDAEQEAAA